MLNHEQAQPVQFATSETMGFRQTDRIQPKLCRAVTVLDMDMLGFGLVEAIKEETKA